MPRYTIDYILHLKHEDINKMSNEQLLSITSQAVSAFNNRSKRAQASKDRVYLEASHFYTYRKEKGKPLEYEKPTIETPRGELIYRLKDIQYQLSLKTSTIEGSKQVVGDFIKMFEDRVNEAKNDAILRMQTRLEQELSRENPDGALILQLQNKIAQAEQSKLKIRKADYKYFLQTYRRMNEIKNEATYGGKYEMWRQMVQVVENSDDLDWQKLSPEEMTLELSRRLDAIEEQELSEDDPDLDVFSIAGNNRRN